MTISLLTDSLQRLFSEEKNRIVFWYDPEREFEECLDSLKLNGVTVIQMDKTGALELKIRLELENTTTQYLVYSPFTIPAPEDDWLLDMRLYSRTFHADRASIVLHELGLINQAMRMHLIQHQPFFRNQERLSRIKKWVRPEDTEVELDLKMLAVLTRAEQPDVFSILMRILGEFCNREECELTKTPKVWSEIEKYGLTKSFWETMKNTFGYEESQPKLTDLIIRLFVNDFAQHLKGELPQPLKHFLLPNRTLALNTSVFLSQWRRNINNYKTYNLLSGCIGAEMKIDEQIESLDMTGLIDVMTFETVERRIIQCLRDQLIEYVSENLSALKEIIHCRCDGHWTSPVSGAGEDGNYYRVAYEAIKAAAELLELKKDNNSGLSYPGAEEMYRAYTKELFHFDQQYRLFHEAADEVEQKGWDILKGLTGVVDSCYSDWFIDQIATTWGNFIDTSNGKGLLHRWSIKDITRQQDFYATYVGPALKTSPQSKVYVVISDAFRFEAAEELTRELNSKYRFKATLNSQLGALPSFTELGMAALLPHKTLDYKDNTTADILVNGVPIASIEQRAKVLSEVQGTAIKAEELIAMNKERGREFVKPWRVIYVYHNQIDAIGDKAATETGTFRAVRMAIKELSALVSFIINNLNGSQVLVTSDHGFLYQEVLHRPHDKSNLDMKPSGTLKAKKRYLLGNQLGDKANVWHGNTHSTAGTKCDMEFWIPKGANCFHFVGGARFVHGGAMLQEIVVPVIIIKELRGEAAEKSAVRKVEVSLLGSVRKVVNNVQRFDFIQTDAVSERVQPRTVSVSLRDGETLISNEVAITFDSQSSSVEDRKKSIKLMVKAGQYDKKKEYALVLRDAETMIEYMRIPIMIDLTFSNDF